MNQETVKNENQTITLGGGCFWCLEAVFDELQGVTGVASGYAGGSVRNPSYSQVCAGKTGHAEVVQVTYEPDEISLDELLEVFFTTHDPTTLNRQGADVGTQYRSIILYHDEIQKAAAEEVIDRFTHTEIWPEPIVTQIAPIEIFYPAEAYHQDYYSNNARQPYCQVVITPKLAKFRQRYSNLLK